MMGSIHCVIFAQGVDAICDLMPQTVLMLYGLVIQYESVILPIVISDDDVI